MVGHWLRFSSNNTHDNLIWSSASLERDLAGGKNLYVLVNTCSKTLYFGGSAVIQAAREPISAESRLLTSHPYLGSAFEIGQPPLAKAPKS